MHVERVKVGDGQMSVVPPRNYNRHRRMLFSDVRDVEDWTLNGPILDGISFISGMKNNSELIRQRRTADQQVPRFLSNMTPPEIAAMLESLYRIKGGAVQLNTVSLQPRPFLGTNGFQWDYEHLDSGRAMATGPRGRRGHRRQALPDPHGCGALALLRRDASGLRSDRRFSSTARLADGRDRARRGSVPGEGGVGTSMSGP